TREALRGGWFHSGDVGIRDANGSYRIVDRVKDMIIRGGFNVYPREIEEVVVSRDPKLGADDVIAYCKERLAAYKYPRIVVFAESLPKGPTGKILKRELRGKPA